MQPLAEVLQSLAVVPVKVAQLAASLYEQLGCGGETDRKAEAVAREDALLTRNRHFDAFDSALAEGFDERNIACIEDATLVKGKRVGHRRRGARIEHDRIDAECQKILRETIAESVGSEDDGLTADNNAVASHEVPRGGGEHHAGQIVVAKDGRQLKRACRNDAGTRTNLMQPPPLVVDDGEETIGEHARSLRPRHHRERSGKFLQKTWQKACVRCLSVFAFVLSS